MTLSQFATVLSGFLYILKKMGKLFLSTSYIFLVAALSYQSPLALAQSNENKLDPRTNAIFYENKLYPLSGKNLKTRVFYQYSGNTVKSLYLKDSENITPVVLSQNTLSEIPSSTSATLDLNGDGVADFAAIYSSLSNVKCQDGISLYNRNLKIYSGNDLKKIIYQSANIPDVCIPMNGGSTIAYVSLFMGALQYGQDAGLLALTPQYNPFGWFFKFGTNSFFYTPETASFAYYSAAQLDAHGTNKVWGALSQPLNGFIVNYGGKQSYIAATSARFLKYDINSYSSSQLARDYPILARKDFVGRNYGLLQHDIEGNPKNVFLINGAAASDLYNDYISSKGSNSVMGTDILGGLERHISMLDLYNNNVSQKFYSYIHDPDFTHRNAYVHRTTYPTYARLPSKSVAGSRMILNDFDGSTWHIHISAPGSVAISTAIKNFYVWDVIPVDRNTVDVVTSPIDTTRIVWVPDYVLNKSPSKALSWKKATYLPQNKTIIYRWKRQNEKFELLSTIEGGVPYLGLNFPSRGTEVTSSGYGFSTVRALSKLNTKKTALIMSKADGSTFEAQLPALPEASRCETGKCSWVNVSDTPIRCQYSNEVTGGNPGYGTCYLEGSENIFEWGTGKQGTCNSPTFLRNKVVQKCVYKN